MINIPTSFIVQSRLASLESKDVGSIIGHAHNHTDEACLQSHMNNYPNRPIIGIGISNPVELKRAIDMNTPIIHIYKDCRALQGVQRRAWRAHKVNRGMMFVISSSLWGLIGHYMKRIQWKRGEDVVMIPITSTGSVPVSNYTMVGVTLLVTVGMSIWSNRILRSVRSSYKVIDDHGEFFLLRDNILRSTAKYYMQTVIPYWLIGFTVYYYHGFRVGMKRR
ncbi:hypothetical protein BDB01DRAFT_791023 [Pilobolus umbonatus]|nr:hypothetical protein BDB01DRAFT_791023 [Pilobolus umbonatus]